MIDETDRDVVQPEPAVLADLRALSDAATPGPWVIHQMGDRLVVAPAATDHLLFATEERGDAAFIAAAANYVRSALAKPAEGLDAYDFPTCTEHPPEMWDADGTCPHHTARPRPAAHKERRT